MAPTGDARPLAPAVARVFRHMERVEPLLAHRHAKLGSPLRLAPLLSPVPFDMQGDAPTCLDAQYPLPQRKTRSYSRRKRKMDGNPLPPLRIASPGSQPATSPTPPPPGVAQSFPPMLARPAQPVPPRGFVSPPPSVPPVQVPLATRLASGVYSAPVVPGLPQPSTYRSGVPRKRRPFPIGRTLSHARGPAPRQPAADAAVHRQRPSQQVRFTVRRLVYSKVALSFEQAAVAEEQSFVQPIRSFGNTTTELGQSPGITQTMAWNIIGKCMDNALSDFATASPTSQAHWQQGGQRILPGGLLDDDSAFECSDDDLSLGLDSPASVNEEVANKEAHDLTDSVFERLMYNRKVRLKEENGFNFL